MDEFSPFRPWEALKGSRPGRPREGTDAPRSLHYSCLLRGKALYNSTIMAEQYPNEHSPTQRYQVRWQSTAHDRVRIVDYCHYSQAEACFIGLITFVDRFSGGWAELRKGERVVARLAEEESDALNAALEEEEAGPRMQTRY